jgi:hypothetical protein
MPYFHRPTHNANINKRDSLYHRLQEQENGARRKKSHPETGYSWNIAVSLKTLSKSWDGEWDKYSKKIYMDEKKRVV